MTDSVFYWLFGGLILLWIRVLVKRPLKHDQMFYLTVVTLVTTIAYDLIGTT